MRNTIKSSELGEKEISKRLRQACSILTILEKKRDKKKQVIKQENKPDVSNHST